jgi:hypothetical protein
MISIVCVPPDATLGTSAYFSQSLFMCLYDFQNRKDYFLKTINHVVFAVEVQCVFCEVETELLNILNAFRDQRVKTKQSSQRSVLKTPSICAFHLRGRPYTTSI